MRRLAITVLFAICLCLCLTACNDSTKLIGTWKQVSDGTETAMVFNEDGTGSLLVDGHVKYNSTYEIKGSSLLITTQAEEENVVTEYKYSFKKNQLILKRRDGDKIVLEAELDEED